MERLIFIFLIIAGSVGFLQAQSTGGRGGGIYAEDGTKVVGTLIYGNRGEEGFGICGGNAAVINCTVAGNGKLESARENIQPGFIYCADGQIVSSAEYDRNVMEAVGVVFWTNSDFFSPIRGYVVALRQALKTWDGPSYTAGVQMPPISDTSAYRNTEQMSVSEAAAYCRNYTAGSFAGRWVLPAAYQLAALFYVWEQVEKTLVFLEGQGVALNRLQEEIYWSSTEELDNNAWAIDFGSGEYIRSGWEESHFVRPVFAY